MTLYKLQALLSKQKYIMALNANFKKYILKQNLGILYMIEDLKKNDQCNKII
jgi:hypothetical protein